MESLSPNFFVKDIQSTIDFYKQIGFTLAMTVPETGAYDWAMMTCGNVSVMFQTFDSLGEQLPEISRQNGAALLFYIKLKDFSAFFDKVKEKVPILKEPEKTFYGATEFTIMDNNGYLLTFAD